ncbi:MAG: hypothetical protein EZS28_046459, partial [Streblomastix strix]
MEETLIYKVQQYQTIHSKAIIDFTNITHQGNTGGSAIKATISTGILPSQSQMILDDCKFEECRSEKGDGGAIHTDIYGQYIMTSTTFKKCVGKNGGGIYSNNERGDYQIGQSCSFTECQSVIGNGGGLYMSIISLGKFIVAPGTLFKDNQARNVSDTIKTPPTNPPPTGYGGGIFLYTGDTGYLGDSFPTTTNFDLSGALYYNNTADNGGQSLYVVSLSLNELCLMEQIRTDHGKYIKGNYSDFISDEKELQGCWLSISEFNALTPLLDDPLLDNVSFYQQNLWRLWTPPDPHVSPNPPIPPDNYLWYVQFRLNGQYPYSRGRDVFGCGWYDDPCASLDFALDEISYRL